MTFLLATQKLSESTARHVLRNCSDPLSTKLQNSFPSLNAVFFILVQNRSDHGLMSVLQIHSFADLLLKLMTPEKHRILKIELTVTVLYA